MTGIDLVEAHRERLVSLCRRYTVKRLDVLADPKKVIADPPTIFAKEPM